MSENESEPTAPRGKVGGAEAYGGKPRNLMFALKQGGGLALWVKVLDRAARQWADVPPIPEAEAELREAHAQAMKEAPNGAKSRGEGRGAMEPFVLISPNGAVRVDVRWSGVEHHLWPTILSPSAREAIWKLWLEPLPIREIPRSLPAGFQFSTGGEGAAVDTAPALSLKSPAGGFEWESQLEAYLVQEWGTLPLSSSLEIVGSQYSTSDRGRIDILCRNKDGSGYTVLELKRGLTGDAVVGQVMRYMGWVRANRVKGVESVSGIIICHDADPKLRAAVSVAPNVDVYTYEVQGGVGGVLRFSLTKLTKND